MAQDQDLNIVMFKWFTQQQVDGVPVSGPILAAQAEKYDRQLNGPKSTFKASAGWVKNDMALARSPFQGRYGQPMTVLPAPIQLLTN